MANNHTHLLVFGIASAVGAEATVYPLLGNGSVAEVATLLQLQLETS